MENEKVRIDIPSQEESQVERAEISETEPAWRLRDFKGFFHFHSWEGSSCAKDSLKRIKDAVARKTGLRFIGFSEHVGWPGEEYWPDKIREEFSDIDALNSEKLSPKIYKGIEANVLADGALDAESDLLDDSDIVVASIHYKNTDEPKDMTADATAKRWCQVMDNYPSVNFLGHPLRDLPEEEWPKMDWDRLCQKAKEKNVAIELSISGHIKRDMPREFLEALRRNDNLVSIAPDFHAISTFLLEEGDLSQEQNDLLAEYHRIKGDIAGITFRDGEVVKGRGLGKPEYTKEEKEGKTEKLRNLREKLKEIEDSNELAQIYDILSSNVRYEEGEEGKVSAKRRPLSYKIMRTFAKRINQLRGPTSEEDKTPIVPPKNIINLWNEKKIEDWINSRKREIKIRSEL